MYYSSSELQLKTHAVSAVFLLIISLGTFQNTAAASFFNAAQEYHQNGYDAQLKDDYQQALSFYYKAVETDPDNAAYLNDLGLMYEQLGQIDDAERSYLRSISVNKKYLPPYANLGLLYKRKQDLAKAAFFLQKRVDLGDPADPWTQKTREELEKLYDSAPHFKEKFVQAQARRMNLQVTESARQNFKNQMVIANAEYNRGLQLLRSNKTLDAIRAFNSSLAFAPDNPKVIKARNNAIVRFRKEQVTARAEEAIEQMDKGNEAAAKQQFNEILTIIPDHPNK